MRTPMQPVALFATLLAVAIGMPSIAAAQDDLPSLPLLASGGTATSRSCPDNAVMTGMRARVGLAVDAIGIRCRPIQADGKLGAESNAGSLMGGTGGTERIRSCPTGTVVVGQRLGEGTPTLVRIGLFCRSWNASTRTTSGSAAMVDVVASLVTAATDRDAMCPSAQRPARKIRAKAGSLVDEMGLTCSTP